ncbi:hypothetical protein CDAR_609511 [Caerostris darwini]|uniref:Uncharacterized protein n=1 Tax=Caerostris darwini TaxID=1538125 RepID=A0AAV4S8X3_9ARAC|nr:hypothetical protein CDAR_609511 [Caerostris darwini]
MLMRGHFPMQKAILDFPRENVSTEESHIRQEWAHLETKPTPCACATSRNTGSKRIGRARDAQGAKHCAPQLSSAGLNAGPCCFPAELCPCPLSSLPQLLLRHKTSLTGKFSVLSGL